MKKLVLLLVVLVFGIIVGGCSNSIDGLIGGDKNANVFTDQGLANKIMDDLKNRPELKGHDLKAMDDIYLMYHKETGMTGRIDVQKPGTTDQVVRYDYKDGKWSDPKPLELIGPGKLEENLGDLNSIDFNKVTDIYKVAEEKAKSIEGGKVEDVIWYDYRINRGVFEATIKINGTKERYALRFDAQGNFIKEIKE